MTEGSAFDSMWIAAADVWDRGVDQQSHALQMAYRAAEAGAPRAVVFAALVHDLAKPLDDEHHGPAAALAFPLLPDPVRSIVRWHSEFVALARGEPNRTARFADLPWYRAAVRFGAWDEASFEVDVAVPDVEQYRPLVGQFT